MKYTRSIKYLYSRLLFLILTISVAASTWVGLWQIRNVQSIPNPDIFQYIGDGYQYLQFKLPPSIHPPPLFPIMITSVAKIISPYTVYPEITATHLINITSVSLAIIFVYLIAQQIYSPLAAFSLSLLLATNQIYLLFGVNVTNEITYSFFLVLAIFLYTRTKHPLVYLYFGLLFLLRYEAITIPLSVFIVEHLYSPKKDFKIKNIIICFTPILIWLTVLHFHSKGVSIADNAYIEEMRFGLSRLPNLESIRSLVEMITGDRFYIPALYIVSSAAILGLVFYQATRQKTSDLIRILSLVFVFHLCFLYVFPNFSVRYYVPIIWILYLLLTYHKSILISITFFSCLLIYNVSHLGVASNFSHPEDMKEYRLLASWLNETKFERPTIVIVYEPHILRYFVKNPKVDVKYDFDTPFAICKDNIDCISKSIQDTSNNIADILVVTSAYSQGELTIASDPFTAGLHHVGTFDYNSIIKNKSLKYLRTVVEGEHWANIFIFTPTPTNLRL